MRRSVGLVMLFAFSVVALAASFASACSPGSRNRAQAQQAQQAWTGEVADLVCTVAPDVAAPADAADAPDANDAMTAVRVAWSAQAAPGRTVHQVGERHVGERSAGTWSVVRTDLSGSDVTLYRNLTGTDAYSVRVRAYVAGADPAGEWTEVACTAADDNSERFDASDLAKLGELLDFDVPLVLFPSSEMVWKGTVVNLTTYEGPHGQIAQAGLQRGHTLGLQTDDDDESLFCLAPYEQTPEAYTRLEDRVGQRAEVVGLLSEDAGMSVITVTSTKPGS